VSVIRGGIINEKTSQQSAAHGGQREDRDATLEGADVRRETEERGGQSRDYSGGKETYLKGSTFTESHGGYKRSDKVAWRRATHRGGGSSGDGYMDTQQKTRRH